MKNNADIEKILLKDSLFEEMVKTKIEQDFKNELEQSKKLKEKSVITDIKKVPKDKLFTKFATYEVINKNSKTRSYINGVQAEGYLGAQSAVRTSLLAGDVDSFVCKNCYVKFIKVMI